MPLNPGRTGAGRTRMSRDAGRLGARGRRFLPGRANPEADGRARTQGGGGEPRGRGVREQGPTDGWGFGSVFVHLSPVCCGGCFLSLGVAGPGREGTAL